MNLSQSVQEMVKADLAGPASDSSIARRYSLTLPELKALKNTFGMVVRTRRRKSPDLPGIIPEHMQQYVVAIKVLDESWPGSAEIGMAREQYDRGDVELCTGRVQIDGDRRDLLVLYSIPRKNPATHRAPYFFRRDGV
jgi:hypothetical protein